MKNYKLLIQYDGTRYFGWEHQPGKDTIQGKIETVLTRMSGLPDDSPVEVIGAGRTDAGVHAKGMVANVRLDVKMTEDSIRDYLNRYLPEDIAVLDVREASDQFHARYKAVGKTYRYTCYAGKVKPVFDRKYVLVLDKMPDVEKMRRAAEYLIGKWDYRSFCGNSHMKKSTVRVVDSIEIRCKKDYITFTYHGTGFLQNQIRIMTGTLLEVGRGAYEPEHVKEIRDALDRKAAGPTADACGLCLMEVDY